MAAQSVRWSVPSTQLASNSRCPCVQQKKRCSVLKERGAAQQAQLAFAKTSLMKCNSQMLSCERIPHGFLHSRPRSLPNPNARCKDDGVVRGESKRELLRIQLRLSQVLEQAIEATQKVRQVRVDDEAMDALRYQVEHDCLTAVARRQPVQQRRRLRRTHSRERLRRRLWRSPMMPLGLAKRLFSAE